MTPKKKKLTPNKKQLTPNKEQPAPNKKQRLEFPLMIAAVVCGMIIRLIYWKLMQPLPLGDMVFYIDSAKAMARGEYFGAMHYHYPPLYSFFIFLFHLVGPGYETSARLVSVISSSLTVIPLYLIGKYFLGPRPAFFAGLAWLFPWLDIAVTGYSEALFTLLVFLSLYFALVPQGDKKWPLPLAGLLLGLANLAKSEALLYFLVVALLVLIKAGKPRLKTLTHLAVYCLIFFIVISPYAYAYYHETGKFSLNPKSKTLFLIYNLGYVSFLYNLQQDQSGHFTNAERIYQKGDKQPIAISVAEVVRKNFRQLAKKYFDNILASGKMINKVCNKIFPASLLIIGLGFIRRRNDYLLLVKEAPLYLIFVAGTAGICLFDPWERFFYSLFPILVLASGKGLDNLLLWMEKGLGYWKTISAERKKLFLQATSAGIIIFIVAIGAWRLMHSEQTDEMKKDFAAKREMAQWLKMRLGPDDTILAFGVMTRITFLLDIPASRQYLLPLAQLPEIVAYAREKQVKYLIVQQSDLKRVNSLAPLFQPQPNYPGLKLEVFSNKPDLMPYVIFQVLPK